MVIELAPRKNKKQGKNQQKHGRNKKKCEIYRMYSTRIVNKKIKLRRHLKKFSNDLQAAKALKNIWHLIENLR